MVTRKTTPSSKPRRMSTTNKTDETAGQATQPVVAGAKPTQTKAKPVKAKPVKAKPVKAKPVKAAKASPPVAHDAPVVTRDVPAMPAAPAGGAVAGVSRNALALALGIDVAVYQPQVDWTGVKASGVSFAFIKATEGTTLTDPTFSQHWQGARDAGLLRGAYHFFHPAEDPVAQAQRFATVVGAGNSDLPPALDLEKSGNTVTTDMLAANIGGVLTWLVTVERLLGLRPVIYTNQDTWDEVVQKLGGTGPDWLARYPLWAANWVYSYADGDQPAMPPGWNQWTFWQFDSPDKCNPACPPLVPVTGVPNGVDIDFFHGTLDQLRSWASARATAAIDIPAGTPGQKTPLHGTHQDVINDFYYAFGVATYWDKITACGLASLADDRGAVYVGPAIEDLPNLGDADRQTLRNTLGSLGATTGAAPDPNAGSGTGSGAATGTRWPQFHFAADKTQVSLGGSVRFSWQVSAGVEAVYFWNGSAFEGVGGTDNRTVAPTAPPAATDYFLKVLANHGQVFQSGPIHIDVSVASVPSPAPGSGSQGATAKPAATPLIGLHLLGNSPFPAGNRGCRFVLCMNTSPSDAKQFKQAFLDAVVMFRRPLQGVQNLSAQRMFDLLQVTADSALVYTGQNEADQSPYGTPDQIKARAVFDIAVARLVKAQAPKAIYAAGSFATLNPDFRDGAVCQALHDGYAEAYNAGLIGFDMHLYSRDYGHIFSDADLIDERNWVNLFTKCGFDPSMRAIYAGETGLDDVLNVRPGRAGFSGLGLSPNEVVRWMQRWVEVESRPITVNGTSYPSPLVGGAIFQCGGNGDPRWNQFDVVGYLEAMRAVWNG